MVNMAVVINGMLSSDKISHVLVGIQLADEYGYELLVTRTGQLIVKGSR